MAKARTAKIVIDNAIRENARWEILSFSLTLLFALSGVGVLVYGAYHGDGLMALAGSVGAGLFWPALNNAVAIRRANMAIRLMEIPLNQARTAEQAAEAIRTIFLDHLGKEKKP